jgi:hypothetical protein
VPGTAECSHPLARPGRTVDEVLFVIERVPPVVRRRDGPRYGECDGGGTGAVTQASITGIRYPLSMNRVGFGLLAWRRGWVALQCAVIRVRRHWPATRDWLYVVARDGLGGFSAFQSGEAT